jgi:hypothetical protein
MNQFEKIQHKMEQHSKNLKIIGDGWNKFSSNKSQIFIPTWVEKNLLPKKKEKNIRRLIQ